MGSGLAAVVFYGVLDVEAHEAVDLRKVLAMARQDD